MAQYGNGLALPPAQTGDYRIVFGIKPVARQRREIIHQRFDIIHAMRARRMARHLGFLPGIQIFIKPLHLLGHLDFELLDLVKNIHRALGLPDTAQFVNFAFQFGYRFFKLQIGLHWLFAPLPAIWLTFARHARGKPPIRHDYLSFAIRRLCAW